MYSLSLGLANIKEIATFLQSLTYLNYTKAHEAVNFLALFNELI